MSTPLPPLPSSAAPVTATPAPEPPRPSGRSRVKSTFIGLQPGHTATGSTANLTQREVRVTPLQQAWHLDPYCASPSFVKTPVTKDGKGKEGSRRSQPIASTTQPITIGMGLARRQVKIVAPPPPPTTAPTATANATSSKSGSMSARITPIAGRRAGSGPMIAVPQTARQSQPPTSAQHGRRANKSAGNSLNANTMPPLLLQEEEKSSMNTTQPPQPTNWITPRPEWLGSPYPLPQPPKDPMIDPLLSSKPTPAAPLPPYMNPSLPPGKQHPHELHLPAAHQFSYYRPLSPPKRHQCEGGPTSHLRHYMYTHHRPKSRTNSPTHQPQAAMMPMSSFLTASGSPLPLLSAVGSASSLHGGSTNPPPIPTGEIAPEAWSSWPFVNPRLLREEKAVATPSAGPSTQTKMEESKESSSTSTTTTQPSSNTSVPSSRRGSNSTNAPPLPGTSRLFASVVTEHDRTLVFEYLRSTYSQLYQWPPQPSVTDGNKEQPESSNKALPTILFRDSDLDRLIEESRTASNCISMLRRLDAELALSIRNGTLGQPQPTGTTTPADVSNATTRPVSTLPPDETGSISNLNLLPPGTGGTGHLSTAISTVPSQASLSVAGTPGVLSHEPSAAMLPPPSAVSSYGQLPPLGPPPPEIVIPTRRPTNYLNSPQELIESLSELRAYLTALRKKLFQWFVHPPQPPLSLFNAANNTVFITQPMVDNLVHMSVGYGLSEEDLFTYLEHLNQVIQAQPTAPHQQGFKNWYEFEAQVKHEAQSRMNAILNPNSVTSATPTQSQPQIETIHPVLEPIFTASSINDVTPSPALLRHAAHSQAYARLLLFKFLRDGDGAQLFADTCDVAATVAEMDALLDATAGLTLGQNYQTEWYPLGKEATTDRPTTSQETRPTVDSTTSRPITPQQPASTSRTTTRPGTPTQASSTDGAKESSPPTTGSPAIVAPGASSTVAASTRAYGSFLAARAIRVLRSLIFHGYSNFVRFDDLITACEIHTNKLREERVKVWEFLTKLDTTANPTNSSTNLSQPSTGAAVSSDIDQSNAAFNIGLFNAFYDEVKRREKARLEAEASRAAQLKQNTHQFGTSHLQHIPGATSTLDKQQQALQQALHHSQASMTSINATIPPPTGASTRPQPLAWPPERFRGSKSALYKSIPGHLPGQKPVTSSGIQFAKPEKEKEKDPLKYFDWGLQTPPPETEQPKGPSNMSRYASAKTLPYTASKSTLLKHSEPGLESTYGSVETEPLPPLQITPEHIDALFGSFDHLLTVPKDTPAILSTKDNAFGVAPAPSAVFDPLVEQEDEDYLLSNEPEEPYNSMDLTMLLQMYKQEHPRDLEGKERQPSYLAAHPLFKPMLDQIQQQQAAAKAEELAAMNEADAILAQQQQEHQSHPPEVYQIHYPQSANENENLPIPFHGHHSRMSDVVAADQLAHPHSTTTETSNGSFNPSTGAAIPTLQSLITPSSASSSSTDPSPSQQPSSLTLTISNADDTSAIQPTRVIVTGPVSPRHDVPVVQSQKSTLASAAPPANVKQSFNSAAEQFALDTSNDLVILDPNADFERWSSLTPRGSPSTNARASINTSSGSYSTDTTRPTTANVDVVPKMLPVVLQTMQILREQGKIKLHSGSSTAHVQTGPAGLGTGSNSLAPFIPNSGAVIPGGSMGSMKTLSILRELASSGRAFFSMQQLIQTVCSMRSERKWQRKIQAQEKKKLIAAGITIATPSGTSNDANSNLNASKRKQAPTPKSSAGSGVTAISSAQFNILSQTGMSKTTRKIQVVDEEADRAAAEAVVQAKLQAGLTSNASEAFLDPSAFPSTLEVPPFPPAPPAPSAPVTVRRRNGRGEIIEDANSSTTANEGEPPEDTLARAWCRARLLTHLSTLLLFQGANSVPSSSRNSQTMSSTTGGVEGPPRHDVIIRMSDVEALLDALSVGPRDALMLAEKVARKSRDQLMKEAQNVNTPQGQLAIQTLKNLPPLTHPISSLLSLLSWFDSQEILFHNMTDLIKSISSGEWAKEYKTVERHAHQRRASDHEFHVSLLGQKATIEAEKLHMEM